jgi:hypothetical protein
MNKKILCTTAMAIAATSASAWLWDGLTEKVPVGMDNETKTGGYWFDYSDNKNGGQSAFQYDVDKSGDSMSPIIDECQGICGAFTLAQGTLTYPPFLGLGFNIVGETSEENTDAAPGDATEWGGICIAYSCDAAPSLELGLGDAVENSLGYDVPAKQLAKASDAATGKVVQIPWEEFAQQGWDEEKVIATADAVKQLVAIKFKIQANDMTGRFRISQIGSLEGGCQYIAQDVSPEPGTNPGDDAVKGVRSVSGVKAMVSGRTLSFSGITSDASVELISLQGRVVKKGMIKGASSLDLSSVDAGVYMVRVSGKSVDYSNKIVLK